MVMKLDAGGLAEWESQLKLLLQDHLEAVGAALYEEGLAIDAISVKDTPVEYGPLRASHYVTPPIKVGDEALAIELGNGTKYAIFVHERTELRHKVGHAKFLENAINQRVPGFLQRLVKRAQQNVKRGRGMTPLGSAPVRPADEPQHAPTRKTFVQSKRAAKRTSRRAVKRPKKT